MQIGDVAAMIAALPGTRQTGAPGEGAQWRYRGRLVARQLDDTHLVIRTPFEVRDGMLRQFPETFSVPQRFARHMMIVADLAAGDPGAIEDALTAAWEMQRAAD
jgi:hypothetical protein